MADLIFSSKTYQDLLARLKSQIRTAQVRAALAVNKELVLLYWGIGREILTRQDKEGWGAKVIERLAKDLRSEFPGMQGLSPRNLKYMRALAEAWPDEAIVQEPLAQLTWYHNLTLLEKVKSPEERLWYAKQAIQYGWSRNVLVTHIETGLYRRQGKALTNFQATLPPLQSDLAQQLLKDPYNFDFLTLTQEAQERDLEQGLLAPAPVSHRTRRGLRLRRQPGAPRSGRRGLQARPAFLPPEAAMLCRHRDFMWSAT
jgi:predicted nuclease of restriction endonuclease-like (RecB) superfamily